MSITFNVVNQSVPGNQTPLVNAGPNQGITLPSSVTLAGTASDDGLPSNTLTTTWTTFSGPAAATFGNANQLNTTATFPTAGTYVLRLIANDGQLSDSDDVTVTVAPEPVSNQMPMVNAGPNQGITLPSSVTLAGTASDDGLPSNTLTHDMDHLQRSGCRHLWQRESTQHHRDVSHGRHLRVAADRQ